MNNKLAFTIILITIILAGLGIYYSLKSFVSPSVEEFTYIKITSYNPKFAKVDNTSHITVIGVVQNNLTTNVRSVKINATFYDVQNNTIGKSYALTRLKIFKPGQRAPFTLYFSSKHILARFDLIASGIKTNEEPIAGLEILNETIHAFIDEHGYHRIVGEVQNNVRSKAVVVGVFCTYYDEDGNVIALSNNFTKPLDLGPGGKATFKLSSKPHKIDPASYEFLAVPHHYEHWFSANYALLIILISLFFIFGAYMKRRGW